MSDVNLEQNCIFESKKNTYDRKFRYAIAFIMKSLKTQFLSNSNSATDWSEIYKTLLSSNYFLLGGPNYKHS